ncbi:M28 family peptidase [Muribaculum caecicola]|uniref:M28 family peptidase n=1 Tax=Muribaculum caecicola TaxID=3038144 RepID=A0AC61S4S5_9BACT|nr:M28 family peptidase [Muribaculum caecicola]THG46985.1 M28 family peptidase [Muribaculum caecicola]
MSIQFKYMQTIVVAALAITACSGNSDKAVSRPDNTTIAHESRNISALEFNADSAYSYVGRQVAMGPRIPGSDAHKECEQFISRFMLESGADTVSTQRGTMLAADGKRIPVANIFAQYNPVAEKRVLLIAHYDTRPWADADTDKLNHNKPVPGANDGASGVGVLLEIARQIGQKRPEIGVDFLFTDAEDMGVSGESGAEDSWCLGTQMWVAQMPYTAANRPAYGILLDMVGHSDAVFKREYVSDIFAPAVNNRVWAVAKASGFASRFADGQGGAVTDDHTFINRAGIPCIDIVDCVNPQTGSFPANWHTINDNMEHISVHTLKAVGQTVLNTITTEKK